MVVSGKVPCGGARGFGGRALTGDRLLDGGMTAFADAQDKTRSQPLPGHKEDQKAADQNQEWGGGSFHFISLVNGNELNNNRNERFFTTTTSYVTNKSLAWQVSPIFIFAFLVSHFVLGDSGIHRSHILYGQVICRTLRNARRECSISSGALPILKVSDDDSGEGSAPCEEIHPRQETPRVEMTTTMFPFTGHSLAPGTSNCRKVQRQDHQPQGTRAISKAVLPLNLLPSTATPKRPEVRGSTRERATAVAA